ncbi:glycosyltransferase family 4 protein [Qipengyuania sp. GH1]|uniref:glycosyltransferase family 4 protein n=1 Tax=Qipengyuania aestuarii TaxID=2867241 RepID=UPI001C881203|nr:glycosyltransferase family 4 protein [Qipengyuania aestuarii]MBX7535950.1 glycosyltransferase family 4 protein [Qipengyuania aestuarii]
MSAERKITICFAFAGDRLGGSHISLKGLLDELPQSLYRILLVLEVPDGRIAEYFRAYEQIEDPCALRKPFKVGRSFGIGNALSTLPRAIGRAKLLKDLEVDIVHTNDGRTHASWALAAKLAGARMVWHHRGDPDARGTGMVAPLLADQIVSVSDYALPTNRWGKLRQAKVIHSPFDVEISVDRDDMRQRLVAELGCPEDAIICGYFGQYIVRKRPVAFIDAVDELRKMSKRPVVGVMFGEAKDRSLSERMQDRLSCQTSPPPVTLMGYRDPGHQWIAACDALLVTALNEPLGRTLVEAMLVRTPVIATRSGGNAEALAPDCGILVPPDDPSAMAKAALRLLGHPEFVREVTDRARRMAERRFTKDRHIRQMEQVYADLVDRQLQAAPDGKDLAIETSLAPPQHPVHHQFEGKR